VPRAEDDRAHLVHVAEQQAVEELAVRSLVRRPHPLPPLRAGENFHARLNGGEGEESSKGGAAELPHPSKNSAPSGGPLSESVVGPRPRRGGDRSSWRVGGATLPVPSKPSSPSLFSAGGRAGLGRIAAALARVTEIARRLPHASEAGSIPERGARSSKSAGSEAPRTLREYLPSPCEARSEARSDASRGSPSLRSGCSARAGVGVEKCPR